MTPAQKARTIGFKASLAVRGRAMTTDAKASLTAIVSEEPLLPDTMHTAQAEKPVYSTVSALSGAIANPRTVTAFTETQTGRVHTVQRYDESSADSVVWKWFCETSRENF